MNLKLFKLRLLKLYKIFTNLKYFKSFLLTRIAPSIEHEHLFKDKKYDIVIDVGANIGQFSLLASVESSAIIYAFEPNKEALKKFKINFHNNNKVKLFNFALGEKETSKSFYITNKNDSSSLLEPIEKELNKFGKIKVENVENITIQRADEILNKYNLDNSILKIDVQGYELNVLQGFEKIIDKIDTIYCECSFIEFYKDQPLVFEIINFLSNKSFDLITIYNPEIRNNKVIQSDFLFKKKY